MLTFKDMFAYYWDFSKIIIADKLTQLMMFLENSWKLNSSKFWAVNILCQRVFVLFFWTFAIKGHADEQFKAEWTTKFDNW